LVRRAEVVAEMEAELKTEGFAVELACGNERAIAKERCGRPT
jgi:hypothetical protein